MILSFTCMSVYDSFILKPETLKKRSCLHLHHWYICLVIVSSCLHCFVWVFFLGGGVLFCFLFLCYFVSFFLIDKWTQNTTVVQNYHTPCSWLWHLLIHVYIWFKPSTQGLSNGAIFVPNGLVDEKLCSWQGFYTLRLFDLDVSLTYCTSFSLCLSESGLINLNKQPYTWCRLNTVRYPHTGPF